MKFTLRSKPLLALAASAIITGALIAPAWPYGSPTVQSAGPIILATGCVPYTCQNPLYRIVSPNSELDWNATWTCIYMNDGSGRYFGSNYNCTTSIGSGCCNSLDNANKCTGTGNCPSSPGKTV